MKNKNILYLASSSKSRQELLIQACIPFKLVKQNVNEDYANLSSLEEVVTMLAIRKMEHVLLDNSSQGAIIYVLTADTLSKDSLGKIHGKPKTKEEAISQIWSISSGPSLVSTAFCLEKKIYNSNRWHTHEQIVQAVTTECIFSIPEFWINTYIAKADVMNIAGSVTIETYGAQFLKEIHGSYTSIIGLPMFEVRQALETLKFFD